MKDALIISPTSMEWPNLRSVMDAYQYRMTIVSSIEEALFTLEKMTFSVIIAKDVVVIDLSLFARVTAPVFVSHNDGHVFCINRLHNSLSFENSHTKSVAYITNSYASQLDLLRASSLAGTEMLHVNRSRHMVQLRGREVVLTEQETAILSLFTAHPNELLPYNRIYREIWDALPYGDYVNTVHVAVNRLKRKLGKNDNGESYITIVRKEGYILRIPPQMLE